MVDEAWLETVRLARDCGDISSLFPPGITRLWDLPHTLHSAIRLALIFLRFEELPKEERPPKRMWLDADKMTLWWAEVKRNRDSKSKGNGSVMDMPQNALMAEIFGANFG
jgi:hypothetical protein